MIQVIALMVPLLTGSVVDIKPSSVPMTGYVQQWVWRRVDYDGRYWFQCYDLMMHAKKTLHNDTSRGSWTAMRTWKTWAGFEGWTRNYPWILTPPPKPWSIIFIDVWHIKWHVAVVYKSTPYSVTIIEQNGWRGSATGKWTDAIRVKTIGYDEVLWWFSK